jgi:hypothetical protein
MKLVGLLLMIVSICSYADSIKTGGDHPRVTVTVIGRGATEDDARRNGFRSAVELAAGNVIVSDTETSGDRLILDRTGSYSSGYVDDYRVLETSRDSIGFMVKMSVTVASSRIAERMQARGEHSEIINGDRIQTQMETEFEQRNKGDQLVAQILDSYPHHAFLVNAGQSEFKISNRRAPYVEIPFAVEMNPAWLTAFDEALSLVAKKNTSCNTLSRMLVGVIQNKKITNRMECGKTPDLRVGNNNYYFYDQETLRVINAELQPTVGYQRIALHVDIQDAGGEIIDHRCTDVNTETFIRYNEPPGIVNNNDRDMILRPEIFGNRKIVGALNIDLTNTRDIGEASKIKITVGKTCQ